MSALYEHQRYGAEWLATRPRVSLPGVPSALRGYLADEPGLGKTRTTIEALRLSGAEHVMIVCPAIVRTHWHREIGSSTPDGLRYEGNATILSYDEIVRGGVPLMAKLIMKSGVDALVLDEAHFLKHEEALRTKILLGPNGYARRMPVVFALSGTPVPKNPMEFWPVLSSLFPRVALAHGLTSAVDMLERFAVVRSTWARGEMRDKILPKIRNEDEFKAILAEIMLRRTLDDVGLDVPTIDWQTVRLNGASTVGDPEFADGNVMKPVLAALDRGESLADIDNDPHIARMRRRLGMYKVGPVATMLKAELAEGSEKLCVFAHHLDVLKELQQQIGGRNLSVAYIDGSTTQKQRDLAIERFIIDPECRVFLGQNLACGTGTDGLQKSGARRAILVEPDWTAANNEQLGKRLARIGGSGRVVVQMIALADTLDESIVGQNLAEVKMAATIGLGST